MQVTAAAATANPLFGLRAITSNVDRSRELDLAVHLPLRNQAQLEKLFIDTSNRHSPLYRHWITPAQFAARFGPAPADVSRAILTLKAAGFRIGSVDTQMIHAIAPFATVERVFGTHLVGRRTTAGMRLMPQGGFHPPAALAALHATFMGLGPNYPLLSESPRARLQDERAPARATKSLPNNRTGPFGGYWSDDLKQAYDFPSGAVYNGSGFNVVIITAALAGASDSAAYFAHELLCTGGGCLAPEPSITDVLAGGCTFDSSGGTACDPGDNLSYSANKNVQQVGGIAPGASIYDVSIPQDDTTFFSAYSYLASINVADVIFSAAGNCELLYTAAYNGGTDMTSILTAAHATFAQLAVQGTTVISPSGNSAGLNCPQPGYFTGSGTNFVNVPSTGSLVDDPAVTGVGGTNLQTAFSGSSLDSTYVSENAVADYIGSFDPYGTGNQVTNEWFGSGGGTSVVFAEPSYQVADGLALAGRGVPDVAMTMGGCPGYATVCAKTSPPYPAGLFDSKSEAYFGGGIYTPRGVSLAAAQFAGWVAVTDQAIHGRLGNPNALLYELDYYNSIVGALHQPIPSYNAIAAYTGTGWNPVVGVGTPKLNALLTFAGIVVPPAGIPQTASNP